MNTDPIPHVNLKKYPSSLSILYYHVFISMSLFKYQITKFVCHSKFITYLIFLRCFCFLLFFDFVCRVFLEIIINFHFCWFLFCSFVNWFRRKERNSFIFFYLFKSRKERYNFLVQWFSIEFQAIFRMVNLKRVKKKKEKHPIKNSFFFQN